MNPVISIIVPTFNRAKTISRSIDSILCQTYDNLEIVIVEDGSTDETMEVLEKYEDKRLRMVYHEFNKGVTAAKNTGLNNIRGEWFTFLDSDDEMVPDALAIMMKIPLEKDASVTAISCNCIDSVTGKFCGIGLNADQYVDFKTINNCSGDFWGLTKTELLLKDRFNELLSGWENVLWYLINERANRYYIHKGLNIVHTEGNDRVTNYKFSQSKTSTHYKTLSEESHYLEIIKTIRPGAFAKDCVLAIVYLIADNKKEYSRIFYNHLKTLKNHRFYKIIAFFAFHSNPFLMNGAIKLLTLKKKFIQ